jgi:dUTP pyrophosphatase
MSLFIYTDNSDLKSYLNTQNSTRRTTDSGFDIPLLSRTIQGDNKIYTFDLEIIVAAVDHNDNNLPILLLPRSSISNTPFRLTNSIGLIDMGYRGNVKAKVDIIDEMEEMYVAPGTRFFQLCQNNFMPWKSVKIVDIIEELPNAPDSRGRGGFGSTGH